MFITIKFPRKAIKCALIILIAAAALTLVAVLLHKPDSTAMGTDSQVQQCIDCLTGFGWTVEASPLDEERFLLPAELSEGYLALQTQAGFDLSPHLGQTVTRYAFEITNYPTGETGVIADVLVREGQVIGGDVRTSDLDGFIHSLKRPS